MAAKRLTLERNTIRTKFEELYDSYAQISNKIRIRLRKAEILSISFYPRRNSQLQLFFNMAAKRLTLERNTIRTKFKDLHVSYATSEIKCKSDQYKPRYSRIK